jgi:hypothetical protein
VATTARASVSEIVILQMPTRKKTKFTETVPSDAGRTVFRADATTVRRRYEGNRRLWLLNHGSKPVSRLNAPNAHTRNTNGLARPGIPDIFLSNFFKGNHYGTRLLVAFSAQK